MIYVSHRLDEVFEIADRMVVLRDGRVVGEREVREDHAGGGDPAHRRPRAVAGLPPPRPSATAPPRLALQSVKVAEVGPIDCAIHAGEIVGLVGPARRRAGNRRPGVVRAGPGDRGRVPARRRPVADASPRQAMAGGINLGLRRPRRRIGDAESAVRENLFLNPIAAGMSPFSLIAPARENRAAREPACSSGRRPNDPTLPIELLSGGNQQKVVVGRWLHLNAKIYVFEDPTAGVDVGAKAEIYRLFDVALQAGAAIVIVSTDFEEVAKVCHRALIFDRGQVVAELGAADLSVEKFRALRLLRAFGARSRSWASASSGPGGAHAVH